MSRRSRGHRSPSPPRRAAQAAGAGLGGEAGLRRPDLAGRFAEVALIVPMRVRDARQGFSPTGSIGHAARTTDRSLNVRLRSRL